MEETVATLPTLHFSHRVGAEDPDGDRLTFGVTGPGADLVTLNIQVNLYMLIYTCTLYTYISG